MTEQPPQDDKTVRVPITAFVAVQKMLNSEGLEDLAREVSENKQVDFQPTIAVAGRLGIDVAELHGGTKSFIESLQATRRLSEMNVISELSNHDDASVKVKISLIKALQARIAARPGLKEKNLVAMAVSKCDPSDPYNCPKNWPNISG